MSETRLVRRDELLQGDKGGGFRGRQPNACFLDAAICAGLRPADVLVYVKRSQGRENRPYKKRSTVDAKSAAFCKSCSAPKRQTKSLRYHCTTVAHSSNRLPTSPGDRLMSSVIFAIIRFKGKGEIMSFCANCMKMMSFTGGGVSYPWKEQFRSVFVLSFLQMLLSRQSTHGRRKKAVA